MQWILTDLTFRERCILDVCVCAAGTRCVQTPQVSTPSLHFRVWLDVLLPVSFTNLCSGQVLASHLAQISPVYS